MGSANWTDNSQKNAFEFDVLLQTEREVHEARQLFDILWAGSEHGELDVRALRMRVHEAQRRRREEGV